jgi:hypothetical protein
MKTRAAALVLFIRGWVIGSNDVSHMGPTTALHQRTRVKIFVPRRGGGSR